MAGSATKGPTYFIVDPTTGKQTEKDLFKVINASDIWVVNGVQIIGLKGIKRLCNAENIVEKKKTTPIKPTGDNKQQHGVDIWVGFKGDNDPDNWRRASGEASQLNTGKIVEAINPETKKKERRYEEFNVVDSQYRFAMADKRAFCRAVLLLLQMPDFYASVESNSFAPTAVDGYDY